MRWGRHGLGRLRHLLRQRFQRHHGGRLEHGQVMEAAVSHHVLDGILRPVGVDDAMIVMVVRLALPVHDGVIQRLALRGQQLRQAGRGRDLPDVEQYQEKGDETFAHGGILAARVAPR